VPRGSGIGEARRAVAEHGPSKYLDGLMAHFRPSCSGAALALLLRLVFVFMGIDQRLASTEERYIVHLSRM